MQRQITISDITCYGALYCVAGWDNQSGQMVRPEPSTTNPMAEASRFWPEQYVGAGKVFALGNIAVINGANPQPPADFPHAREDCILAANSTIQTVGQVGFDQLATHLGGSVRSTLIDAFNNGLVRALNGKCHIPASVNAPSLSAIEVDTAAIEFYVDTYDPAKPKLRARLVDSGVLYDLSVPAAAARLTWKSQGLEFLQAELSQAARVQVRVGLCRAFGGKCYAQINGIIPVQ